jgi:hypothetical protein
MSKMPALFLFIIYPLVAIGCEGNAVRTISSGSHVPYSDAQWAKIEDKQTEELRLIVWGNHAGATRAAVEMVQHSGAAIVEPARLQMEFEKRQMRLSHTSDDNFLVLKVGRLAGANRVVFVEASDKPAIGSGASIGSYGGASQSSAVHQVSVAVRSVDIETGAVRWRGYSTLTQPTTDPEVAIPLLTKAAMTRATCALERGREWVEYGAESSGLWGCRK